MQPLVTLTMLLFGIWLFRLCRIRKYWKRFFQSDHSRAISSGTKQFFSASVFITRDQSDRSDLNTLAKTCDETGRRATPICLPFSRLNAEWNSMEKHAYG